MRKHWNTLALFVVAVIFASFDAIYVFLRFVDNAQLTGIVPATLALWTIGNLVTFILLVIF